MDHEADFIKETRYLAEHMRRSCEHALWRVEQLLSRLQEGESLNTSSTAAQLDNAREQLRRVLGGIERIEALCELESRRKEGWGEYPRLFNYRSCNRVNLVLGFVIPTVCALLSHYSCLREVYLPPV